MHLFHLLLLLLLPGLLTAADAPAIALAWTDQAPNETGYRVQRRAGAGAWLTLADALPPNSTSWTDTVVLAGTAYTYRVQAFNAAGGSPWSNEATVTLPPAETVPVAPGPLTARIEWPGRLVNLSTRAPVLVGDDIVIAGFVVAGDRPARLLLRAVGPGLAAFGVPGVLADPRLQLVGGPQNDDWQDTDGAALAAAAARVFAFPLADGSRDAALLVTLPPGAYTVHVTGAPGQTGNVLVETYLVPEN